MRPKQGSASVSRPVKAPRSCKLACVSRLDVVTSSTEVQHATLVLAQRTHNSPQKSAVMDIASNDFTARVAVCVEVS